MEAVVEVEDAAVVRNFWLDCKKLSLKKFGILRIVLYVENQIHYLWQEDASMHTFSSKVKDLLDHLHRRGAFCDYNFTFSEKTIVIGLKHPSSSVPYYIEKELA